MKKTKKTENPKSSRAHAPAVMAHRVEDEHGGQRFEPDPRIVQELLREWSPFWVAASREVN